MTGGEARRGPEGFAFRTCQPFNVPLALLAVWMVADAWLSLEDTAGIPVRLACALAGIVIMVLMHRVR